MVFTISLRVTGTNGLVKKKAAWYPTQLYKNCFITNLFANHFSYYSNHIFCSSQIKAAPQRSISSLSQYQYDLADVKGQLRPRRALEIAAAGGHSLLFKGPPGTGKTLLASRLPSILPPLNAQENLEVASIYSVANAQHHFGQRPFRAPHHTASAIALVGGGCHFQ